MSVEHPTGRMGLQEILAAPGGLVSREREGSQVSFLPSRGAGPDILETTV